MKESSQHRFSLLENGILDRPSAKILLINVGSTAPFSFWMLLLDTKIFQGMLDDVFPIEDSILALQYGSIKEARFIPGNKHLGVPVAEPIIFGWIEDIFSREDI